MCDFLGTDGHGFLKRHGWAARWVRLYLLRAILKYRHGSLPQSKLSCELAKQAVITKYRGYIYAEPSRAFIKNKAVDFRAKIKICDNQTLIIHLCKSVDKNETIKEFHNGGVVPLGYGGEARAEELAQGGGRGTSGEREP